MREVSVLFSVLIGALVLREALTLRRLVGASVIITGVMAQRLG